ncbi:MAG: hypothetical protein QOD51_1512 [Candidatus Eremiobacteraeota bacterium]|nr:hypothetical protein [Candidatus Eremiobacteraeota bacterium]
MTTTRRVEWRGELFASDLSLVLGRLAGARITRYDLPHTLTIFLQQDSAASPRIDRTLRLRSYSDLAEITPETVRRVIADGIAAKLQLKAAGGATTEIGAGRIVMLHAGAEPGTDPDWELRLGADRFEPASVRVARRTHHELSGIGARPVRVTVDHERHLFRVAGGVLRPLGEMGPRVEVKAATANDVDAALAQINPDGVMRRLRFRSLELLFQDLLREIVVPNDAGSPEIEMKFAFTGEPAALSGAAIDWLVRRRGTRLLLPFPHQIVRMRRYHVCTGENDGAQRTVVETTAGRLSPKTKRGAVMHGGALLRDTAASRSTDIDGARERVEAFVARHGWRRTNVLTKVQSKIPFVTASGNAYLASIDDCADTTGATLRQLELEYIGRQAGAALSSTEAICGELERLGAALRSEHLGNGLLPTTQSKHEFFGG